MELPQSSSRALIFLMEEFVVDVRPEFLEDVGRSVEAHVEDPTLACLGPATFLGGVVKIGDAGGSARSNDFRSVEGFVSVIGAGDGEATECVKGSLAESAMAEGIEARILMKKGGHDEFGLVIFVHLVGEGVPIITTVPDRSLMKFRVRVLGLANSREDRDEDKVGVVEGVLGAFFELLLKGFGGKFCIRRDGTEIGNDAEDALGLFTLQAAVLWIVLRCGRLRLGSRGGRIYALTDERSAGIVRQSAATVRLGESGRGDKGDEHEQDEPTSCGGK